MGVRSGPNVWCTAARREVLELGLSTTSPLETLDPSLFLHARLACHSQHGRRCADGSRTELSRSGLPRTGKDINSGGRIEGEEQHCIAPRPTVGGTDGVNGDWVNSWYSCDSYLNSFQFS